MSDVLRNSVATAILPFDMSISDLDMCQKDAFLRFLECSQPYQKYLVRNSLLWNEAVASIESDVKFWT